MTDKEDVLRFNFHGSYDDLEPAENGEIMRAFDYDRLAAKLDAANAAADRIDELKTKLAKLKLERNYANDVINSYVAQVSDLKAKLEKAVDALDEAVYLLRPDEKDMMRKAGVYRVVTTLAELTGEKE